MYCVLAGMGWLKPRTHELVTIHDGLDFSYAYPLPTKFIPIPSNWADVVQNQRNFSHLSKWCIWFFQSLKLWIWKSWCVLNYSHQGYLYFSHVPRCLNFLMLFACIDLQSMLFWFILFSSEELYLNSSGCFLLVFPRLIDFVVDIFW